MLLSGGTATSLTSVSIDAPDTCRHLGIRLFSFDDASDELEEYVDELEQAVLDLEAEKDALIETIRVMSSDECWVECDYDDELDDDYEVQDGEED